MSPMRTLVLQLPLTPVVPGAACAWAWQDAPGQALSAAQRGAWSDWPRPRPGQALVVLVPCAALSWHRVVLPAGLGPRSPRLSAALMGLLQDQCLQAPQTLQLALPPQWRAQQAVWVAAFDRTWLQQALQALQDEGVAVRQVVPEWSPAAAPASGQWLATGTEPGHGWLWCRSSEHGVWGWPLRELAHCPYPWPAGTPVQAEAGVAQALQSLGTHPVALQAAGAHWQQALEEGWNLAQGPLRGYTRAQGLQRLQRAAQHVLQHPAWRPARWGLVALLLSQWLALQAWAWRAERLQAVQQAQWAQLVQDTFPQVRLVVDAPLQMAREVQRLRAASGQASPHDLEWQLAALGRAWPAHWPTPSALSYQDGTLSWAAPKAAAAQDMAWSRALQDQGLRLNTAGPRWQLSALEGHP